MDANRGASVVKRAMIAQADARYLLVDHTKFNQRKLSLVEPLGAIDAIITDCLPDTALLAALSGAEVIVYAADEAALNKQ
jgi:DeoR/GlpR family transcriptional regulator of sugar metabolism